MRCLTVSQPYASLIMAKVKLFETRPWSCPTGPLLIHAGNKFICRPSLNEVVRRHLGRHIEDLPKGVILGTVNVTGVYDAAFMEASITAEERAIGFWRPGYYAWRLENPEPIEPIKVRGQPGLWWYEGPVAATQPW